MKQQLAVPCWMWVAGAAFAMLGLGLLAVPLLMVRTRIPEISGPDGQLLGASDLTSMMVAGPTLLLAPLTGSLAVYTRHRPARNLVAEEALEVGC